MNVRQRTFKIKEEENKSLEIEESSISSSRDVDDSARQLKDPKLDNNLYKSIMDR
jgi:hypothetical protein